MTEKQTAFLEALFSDECRGDVRRAMDVAGYSKNSAPSAVLAPLQDAIFEKTKEFISSNGPKAAFSMLDVMGDPTALGNKEKLSAAKDFLDRGGFKATEKVEVKAESPLFILPPKGE